MPHRPSSPYDITLRHGRDGAQAPGCACIAAEDSPVEVVDTGSDVMLAGSAPRVDRA